MFTGIVEEIGTVKSVSQNQLTLQAHKVLEGTKLGDSIAVNGTCLTITELREKTFAVGIMPETLRRTNLGELKINDQVNLERALEIGGRLGGHFVQGHIDGTGKVISLNMEGQATVMKISAPPETARYLVEKGFIAIDGTSLTITECDSNSFSVALVSFTKQNSIIGNRRPGDSVNLEVDIIAKYIEKLNNTGDSRITLDFLSEHGFA